MVEAIAKGPKLVTKKKARGASIKEKAKKKGKNNVIELNKIKRKKLHL